jgi:phage regulator Rha-like protein
MLGLSNLYYIDPEDQEILKELREVRLQTMQLMLSVSKDELARQFQADFGDRFWAMAQSGIQKENLDANEISQRDALQQWLSETPQSLHQEGGIQRFAAVLLFNTPGSVRLANPERNLPAWFVDGFKRFCSMAQG